MFSISTRVRYGLRGLICIAEDFSGKPVPLKSVAESTNISHKYLESIFNSLKNAGVVKSSRGPEGGYSLSCSPDAISVYDIITAIDGPLETIGCINDLEVCERVDACLTRPFWNQFQDVIIEFLRSRSLQDLMHSFETEG